ncbi:MAG: hypothetical protein LC808_35345 [Actinobacteria bacterium]|nr:hypothetical protein [Actinomycetota bacterium]
MIAQDATHPGEGVLAKRLFGRGAAARPENVTVDSSSLTTSAPPQTGRERHVACIVRAFKVVEDAIHVVVAVLLTALGVALIIYTLRHIAVILAGPHNVPVIVPAVLNEILLLSS